MKEINPIEEHPEQKIRRLKKIGVHYGFEVFIDFNSHSSPLTNESIVSMYEKRMENAEKFETIKNLLGIE